MFLRRAYLLILLIGLSLISCVAGKLSKRVQTRAVDLAPVRQVQETSAVSPFPASGTPPVNVETDRTWYREGETIIVTISNNSTSRIHFLPLCSLHLCASTGADWICVERECDGPLTPLDPGEKMGVLREATALGVETVSDATSGYKLDYQVVEKDPYYFAYSNDFIVQRGRLDCRQARRIALENVLSSPHLTSIDTSRAFIRWQDDDQTCAVDFAWQGAEQIRDGLWSDGYLVIVAAGSGQVIEAEAYER